MAVGIDKRSRPIVAHEQYPVISRAVPAFLHHGAGGLLAEAGPLVQSARVRVGIGNDGTQAVAVRVLGDPVVGKALACLHRRLDHDWTLDELAREVGTSRSVLTERFGRYLDIAPIEYLRRRRLERAADQLTATGRPVANIAWEVGYGSEAAFSRSFRRAYGCSPGAFRKATRGEGADGD